MANLQTNFPSTMFSSQLERSYDYLINLCAPITRVGSFENKAQMTYPSLKPHNTQLNAVIEAFLKINMTYWTYKFKLCI